MGPYYANAGPEEGSLKYRDVSDPIAIFEAPEDTMPIGRARCIGWDAAGSGVWRLVIGETEVEGPWVIVDREFLLTDPGWREVYRRDAGHEGGRADRSPGLDTRNGDRSSARGRRVERQGRLGSNMVGVEMDFDQVATSFDTKLDDPTQHRPVLERGLPGCGLG
jgi:hypothetical protein